MAALTGGECYDLWMSFIFANFLTTIEARGGSNCPKCNSNRECNNHYCLACKEGGLCPANFKTNQPHDHHPWLQVRRVTKENVVNAIEVETFLGENAKRIQKFIGNGENIFKLRTPARSAGKKVKAFDDPLQLVCRGCDLPISKTSNSKDGVKVCSIECLTTYAKRVRHLDYLMLKAGLDLQKRDYVHPLTVEEKIHLQLQKKQKTSALKSQPMSSAHVHELDASTSKDKDDSGVGGHVSIPIAKGKNPMTTGSAPMSKPSLPSVKRGGRFDAFTTKEEDAGGALAPKANHILKRKSCVSPTMVKDAKGNVAEQARATHVGEMVGPSEVQVCEGAKGNGGEHAIATHVGEMVGPSEVQVRKDAKGDGAQQAKATRIGGTVVPSEVEVRVYDYSTFPLGYECRDLDVLCESFDVSTE